MKAKARMCQSNVNSGSQTGASNTPDLDSNHPTHRTDRQLSVVPNLLNQDRSQDSKAYDGDLVFANSEWSTIT
jgi:hypothetical protein